MPTTNLLCPLLTSAPRSGTLAAPSVLADTMQISRGKFARLHRTPAESTALALMDTGLRRYGPARPTRDASYSVSVRQVAALLPRFFQTAPRGHRPCASLALRLHQTLGRGLSPPSCQTCSAHPGPWKSQNDFHRPVEISHSTRDSHIPTAAPRRSRTGRKTRTRTDTLQRAGSSGGHGSSGGLDTEQRVEARYERAQAREHVRGERF